MQEYVKVLLCMQKKLEEEARELEKAGIFKAYHSYYSEKNCETIVLEILRLQERAEAYRSVGRALEEIVSTLPSKVKDAIAFRFYHKEIPKGAAVRTLYRNSVHGVSLVARRLAARGFTKEWFLAHCGEDVHMMYLYRFYRSQVPIGQRKQTAACARQNRSVSETVTKASDSRNLQQDSAQNGSALQS